MPAVEPRDQLHLRWLLIRVVRKRRFPQRVVRDVVGVDGHRGFEHFVQVVHLDRFVGRLDPPLPDVGALLSPTLLTSRRKVETLGFPNENVTLVSWTSDRWHYQRLNVPTLPYTRLLAGTRGLTRVATRPR